MLAHHARLKDRLLEPGRRFTIEEASEVVNQLHDDCTIDTEDRFHNIFFHEICPLLLIGEHVGNKTTSIIFAGTDSRFDGVIIPEDGGKKQTVEMTAAIDGHQQAIRMELLRQQGTAPAFQEIKCSGTKINRQFGGNQVETVTSQQYDKGQLCPLFEKNIKKKIKKAKTNIHYSGAWLGIVFDDWVMPVVERKKSRFDPVCKQVLEKNSGHDNPFSRVFFIGISRKYLYDSSKVSEPASPVRPIESHMRSRSQLRRATVSRRGGSAGMRC